MSGPGAAGWRAGSSITSSSRAGRSDQACVAEADRRCWTRTWPHATRRASADRAARHRHRLRGAGGLCLGAAAGVRAGGAGQGRRGLQPLEPGVGADLSSMRPSGGKRLRRGRAALDGGGLDLQGRDLPLPAARPADRGGHGRRGRRSRPASVHLPRLGRERMAEAARRPSSWSRCAPSAASPGWNGRSCASATRRWTAGSMPAPPPGSPARIAGPRRDGRTWRRRWSGMADRCGTGEARGGVAASGAPPGAAPVCGVELHEVIRRIGPAPKAPSCRRRRRSRFRCHSRLMASIREGRRSA